MLYTRFYRIKPERVAHLRSWLSTVAEREDEALESYRQEGTRFVQAHLIDAAECPVLVFVAEVDDAAAARAANVGSDLAIDTEHRTVMHDVVAGAAACELLYEFAVPSDTSSPAT